MRVVRSRRRRAVVRGLHAETRSAQLPLRARLVRTSESESSECESESVLSAPVEPVESDEELAEDSARRRCLIPRREVRCESPVCSSKVIWQRRRWVDVKERGRAKRRRPPLPPRLAADLLTPAAHHRVTRTHQSHHGFCWFFFSLFLEGAQRVWFTRLQSHRAGRALSPRRRWRPVATGAQVGQASKVGLPESCEFSIAFAYRSEMLRPRASKTAPTKS